MGPAEFVAGFRTLFVPSCLKVGGLPLTIWPMTSSGALAGCVGHQRTKLV